MKNLWRFIDESGTFSAVGADKINTLYFPLANERMMSCVTPDLRGDAKTGQNTFLLAPVSRLDLSTSLSSRNFWVKTAQGTVWSAAGVSKNLAQLKGDKVTLEAGMLWQKVRRENRKVGLRSEILSFVPAGRDAVEVMQVAITNISNRAVTITPTAAIPIYARSASTIRDHRHVSSLLQRVRVEKSGVTVTPTLLFDEAGHHPNSTRYFVLGYGDHQQAPQHIYATQESFCGDDGDLKAPSAVFDNRLPAKDDLIQGKEAMGALRFPQAILKPKMMRTYTILLGISETDAGIRKIFTAYNRPSYVSAALKETKKVWSGIFSKVEMLSAHKDVDNWYRWVSIQPTLRRIFGCSFLPDFDYGKGGRGWRDLWQDCLGLMLSNPDAVRNLLINNFSGVRMDGSNATIIGSKPGEFIADRNNIPRVWMDHGIWPLITLDLYINETGDTGILFEETTYFRDQHIFRSRKIDETWDEKQGRSVRTKSGALYRGSIFEHLLVQTLAQFFNVGAHNHVRLEGADWNDGLDMAKEKGESVAFSAMYSRNLLLLARLLLMSGHTKIYVAKEVTALLKKLHYNSIGMKHEVIDAYFNSVKSSVSGKKVPLDAVSLARDLLGKSEWMAGHIRKNEWLKEGFFNGYYDNTAQRVEGRRAGRLRMMLASQVFPIMAGVADRNQAIKTIQAVEKNLRDKKTGGYHLNTDFGAEQHHFGRAFSFVYGEKENGAYFNHMIVMYAFALYTKGFVDRAWKVLASIIRMSLDSRQNRIFPCLPEYFNREGRGMYSYLTGSASWFVLTMVAQAFGVRGDNGDLLIEPKLSHEQFGADNSIALRRVFAGRDFLVTFINPRRLPYAKYRIVKVVLNSKAIPFQAPSRCVIKRRQIRALSSDKQHKISIHLG